MNEYRRPPQARRAGARILDTAEGVLVALRRCRLDRAFVEIMQTAKQHGLNAVTLADALVALAEGQLGTDVDDAAAAVALSTWGHLFSGDNRVRTAAEHMNHFPGENDG
jgi:hypothetical protein